MKKNNYTRFLLTLILVLIGLNTSWADSYIDAFGLQFYEDGSNPYNKTNNDIDDGTKMSFGNKTCDWTIAHVYANIKKNGENVCSGTWFGWQIFGPTGTSWASPSPTSDTWEGDYHYTHWGTENSSASRYIELVKNRLPGDYNLQFLFSWNYGGCSDTRYCKYSDHNWKISWTIPEPTITITGASSLVVGTSTNITASISNYPVGATLTRVDVTGNLASSLYETGTGTSVTVNSVTPNASGASGITVTVTVTYGSAGTKTYDYYYDVTPPAVSDYTVTPSGSGYLSSGSGTAGSPWLVTYNGTLTLGLSGATQASTDNNSAAEYSTDGGSNYGTTGTNISQTISSITTTTNANWHFKARLKNTTTSSLLGAVNEKIVYWKVPTYTVTLDKNGGGADGSATAIHGTTSLTSLSAPTKTGYDVEGYYSKDGSEDDWGNQVATSAGALQASATYTDASSKWNSMSNQTLYTKWTAHTYTITLNKGTDGTNNGTATVQYDASALATKTDATKTGYSLTGYYTNASSGTKVLNADGSFAGTDIDGYVTSSQWTKAADCTLYAQWTENMTTVTLAASPAGKGSFTVGGAEANSTTAGVTTTRSVTAVPASGYYVNTSATVWAADNANISLSTTSAATTTVTGAGTTATSTLTATFTPNPYSVRFNANGGTGEAMSNQDFTYDVAQNLSENTYTRTGYTFDGWATADDGAKVYDDQESVSNLTATKDATFPLYAHWTAKNYTVTLDYDETGYGSAGVGVLSSVSATFDAAMPAMGTAPTPAPGYKFMGYWTEAGGEGTQYYDADGTSVNNWDIASATTLYAYYQMTEITSLEHPYSISNGETVYLVVNPVFNQTGAQPYMAICWSLLYDNDNPVESGVTVAPYTEEGAKPNQVRFTLSGLAAGYYKVKAELKANASDFSACDAGSALMNKTSEVRIAGNSVVTIQYQDTLGNTIRANASVEVARGDEAGIKAPNIVGYTFYKWILGDVLDSACVNSAVCGTRRDSINITASYDGILTATYVKKKMVYFNNTVGWDTVFVYFYNNASGEKYWNDTYGSGANQLQYWSGNAPFYQGHYGGMKRVAPGSNIWYFDYLGASIPEGDISDKISFAAKDQAINKNGAANSEAYFYETEAIFREDFNPSKLPMFVPLTTPTQMRNDNTTKYYEKGYWMNYPDSTGYKLEIYNQVNYSGAKLLKERAFTFNADKKMPMSVTVDLEAGRTYGFKIYRNDNTYYSNGVTMTNGHSGDGTQAVWEFTTGILNNAGLQTTSAGDYIFTLKYGEDESHNYNYLVGVHYPEATGDFRVQYKDAVHTNWLTSVVIPADSERDTISYFVRTGEGKNPYIRVQKCTATWDGSSTTINWNNEYSGNDILPDTISADGVYNFIFTKSNGALVLEKVEPYDGNFYIRVDGAGSTNWDNFRAADHLMPYSDYSFKQATDPYSHYFCKWYDCSAETKNIKFVVANDYSVNISDTITQDDIADAYVNASGVLSRSANVRFMYNYKTNDATRRYVDGAQGVGSNDFLKILLPDGVNVRIRNYTDTRDSVVSEVKFKDNGDWVYEADVKAKPGTTYKLRSHFGEEPNEVIQWFKGGDSSYETLIGGTGDSLRIRLIYDYKTNRVVSAYVPSGTISTNLEINADIMFMREHQGDIEQITFASGKSISEIQNIYCGIRFNKWTLNNKSTAEGHATLSPLLSRYERDIFYVSFPYNVRVSDIIGFGTYGTHWIMEYYDGAARAENGFWADSESYWKYVTPAMKDTFMLKAGTGYIVALDLDELYYIDATHKSSVWNNTDEVELLFPGNVNSISETDVTYTMPTHQCTINRETPLGDRRIKDSNWNVLGVPTFKNITGAASVDGGGSGAIVFSNTAWIKDSLKNDLKFIYDGNLADNSLSAKAVKDFEFKAMHAYVVQYCGDVTFTTSATDAPASVVARRTYAEAPQETDFRLDLNRNGVTEDQTFLILSNDEDVSADFAFGEDLSKVFNSRANIYTFIGTEWVAGNTLPMSEQTTLVPVGVKVAEEGEYTFSMPEGTNGVGVTLIDNQTGERTNLGLTDYTVTLTQGQIDDRFMLEISPISQISTDIEAVSDQHSAVRKVMIDGILYIVKDGKVFDARGNYVK